MPIPSETVALPLVKGLDIQTDARLVQGPSLLEATNTQFSGGGAKKRRGHTTLKVRTEGAILQNPPSPADWTYGVGIGPVTRPAGQEDTLFWVATNPELGKLRSVFSRDNETVLWDGFRMVSYMPSQLTSQAPLAAEVSGSACIPTLVATPIAKFSEAQARPAFADNGLTKIVAWKSGSSARYAVYDSSSDALVAQGTFAVTTTEYLQCFTLGNWMHVLVRDDSDDKAELYSINSYEPNSVTYRSYGDANFMDVWKVSDTEAVMVRTNADGVYVQWIGPTGAGAAGRTHFNYTPANPASLVSIAYNANSLGIVWLESSINTIRCSTFSHTGTLQRQGAINTNVTGTVRLTLTPKKIEVETNHVPWDVFWDNGTDLRTQRFWDKSSTMNFGTQRVRFNKKLASRAFRVGDRSFVWAGHQSNIQSTWYLLDEGLLPVGKMNFGVANVSNVGTNALTSINFKLGEDYDSLTPKMHLALSYKLRVAPNDSTQATVGIYAEPTPEAVYLDFMPRLRTAQAGRATYVAGAQLWSYDGKELVESNFHMGPEVSVAQANGGALTALGTYSYRVDLCHRNAQNEEVRSLSILTSSLELTDSNQTINLTIPTVMTRRSDAYFLIYRNAMEDGVPLVNWWLLNSRDPTDASYRANDMTVTSVSYSDTGAVGDVAIQTRELHPASDTYVQPVSAPACQIIAAGRDRLWVAGGELPPGKVAPSRLFDPSEVPSFNAYLEFQVDRSDEPVTAAGFIGEVGVFFRPNSTYLIDSDGPDNNASGFWNPPRLALADVGAVSQDSVVRITAGLVFQSPAGFRLLGPGGALTTVGLEIDKTIKTFDIVGAILVEPDQEVRFYGTSETYVFNYVYGTWAKWTCGGVGVSKNNNGYALIAKTTGDIWIETPNVYKDGNNTYTHRIRTSWLHGGNLGDFQRVRRVGGLGRFANLATANHTLRLELFYDEREFWEERVEWSMPDSTVNTDTWGTATWGAGTWGDNSAVVNNLEDLTWEWERRPARQKCSVFSVALEDVNTDGPGFELSAFTFELARKQGLNKGPERTGTGSYR